MDIFLYTKRDYSYTEFIQRAEVRVGLTYKHSLGEK